MRPSSSNMSTTEVPTSSGFSKPNTESPATSAPEQSYIPVVEKKGNGNKKRRVRKAKRSPAKSADNRENALKRYWNEFDDGEEAPEAEIYTVLVDPDRPGPFADSWKAIRQRGGRMLHKLQTIFTAPHSSRDERAPLLRPTSDYFSFPPDPEQARAHNELSPGSDTNSSSTSSTSNSMVGLNRGMGPGHGYGRPMLPSRFSTFPSYHSLSSPLDPLSTHAATLRDQRLARFAVAAFMSSLLLLIGTGLVQLTWRNGVSSAADILVVFGIVVSVTCAIAGVGLAAAKDVNEEWMGRALVGLGFAVLCVGNGVLVVHLAGG